jgi:signal transduction histidine kinase
MLHEFLSTCRARVIARTSAKLASESDSQQASEERQNRIWTVLDQLVVVLEEAREVTDLSALRIFAARHGRCLFLLGFTVSAAVRDYGCLAEAVSELADEGHEPMSAGEYRTFHLCLDAAIAGAVTEYVRLADRRRGEDERERLGALAHELRNRLSAAMLAFSAIRSGRVPFGGSTGQMLWRNLEQIRDRVDRSLTQVRLESGFPAVTERIVLAELIDDVEIEASLEAEAHDMTLQVTLVAPEICVLVERATLTAAVITLLQNAFQFSRPAARVSLSTSATAARVLVEVGDECGGLPGGVSEALFQPHLQMGKNRRGLGIGLSISRRAVEASGGELRVRDLPGRGCVFTIDLPRCA